MRTSRNRGGKREQTEWEEDKKTKRCVNGKRESERRNRRKTRCSK